MFWIGVLRLDVDLHRELFERPRRLAVGLERVDVLDEAAVLRGDRLVAELDLLVPLGRDREDPQPHQAVAEVFEQAGVLGAADDVGVDLVGVLGVEQFARLSPSRPPTW